MTPKQATEKLRQAYREIHKWAALERECFEGKLREKVRLKREQAKRTVELEKGRTAPAAAQKRKRSVKRKRPAQPTPKRSAARSPRRPVKKRPAKRSVKRAAKRVRRKRGG